MGAASHERQLFHQGLGGLDGGDVLDGAKDAIGAVLQLQASASGAQPHRVPRPVHRRQREVIGRAFPAQGSDRLDQVLAGSWCEHLQQAGSGDGFRLGDAQDVPQFIGTEEGVASDIPFPTARFEGTLGLLEEVVLPVVGRHVPTTRHPESLLVGVDEAAGADHHIEHPPSLIDPSAGKLGRGPALDHRFMVGQGCRFFFRRHREQERLPLQRCHLIAHELAKGLIGLYDMALGVQNRHADIAPIKDRLQQVLVLL